MHKQAPLPKKFWIYLIIILICFILSVANFYRVDCLAGDKPFSEYTQRDWYLVSAFLVEEFVILCIYILIHILMCKTGKKRYNDTASLWEKYKYMGIKPDEFDYVWFHYDLDERALISKSENHYKLCVQVFNERTLDWEAVNGVSVYDSLDNVKKSLIDDYEFYCWENDDA